MAKMGWALRVLLISDSNSCLKDRKVSGRLIRKCAPGIEMVDWLMNLSPVVHTRIQATGMWQALLEEGVLSHGIYFSLFTHNCYQTYNFILIQLHMNNHSKTNVSFTVFVRMRMAVVLLPTLMM